MKSLIARILGLPKKTKIIIGSSAGVLLVGGALLLFFSLHSYALSSRIRISADAVPAGVEYYVEINNPVVFFEGLRKSAWGKELLDTKTIDRFIASRQMDRLSSLIDMLQIRSGELSSIEELATFAGGSAGFGLMPDGSWIAVIRTSLKSRIGAAILTSFKAKKVPQAEAAPTTAKKESSGEKTVGADTYSPAYAESTVKLGNLDVYRMELSGKTVFMVMMGEFLFASSRLESLQQTLAVATSGENSITTQEGGSAFRSSYGPNDVLIYGNPADDTGKMIRSLTLNCRSAILTMHPGETITGEIYAIGGPIRPAGTATENLTAALPLENTATLVLGGTALSDISAIIDASDLDADDEFKSLVSSMGITSAQNERGIAATLAGLSLSGQELLPDFAISYRSGAEQDIIAPALFKTESRNEFSYQNRRVRQYRIAADDAYYAPSYYFDKGINTVASSRAIAEAHIAAAAGNAPVLADGEGAQQITKFGAPGLLVVRMPALLADIRDFYYYGAIDNERYTQKTIDQDIMPLFSFLKNFSELRCGFGKAGGMNGMLVISPAKR